MSQHEHHHHGSESEHHQHEIPMDDKARLVKMIEHWIHHNEDHARSFADWAQRAERLEARQACDCLQEAVAMMERLNQRFREALQSLQD